MAPVSKGGHIGIFATVHHGALNGDAPTKIGEGARQRQDRTRCPGTGTVEKRVFMFIRVSFLSTWLLYGY